MKHEMHFNKITKEWICTSCGIVTIDGGEAEKHEQFMIGKSVTINSESILYSGKRGVIVDQDQNMISVKLETGETLGFGDWEVESENEDTTIQYSL